MSEIPVDIQLKQIEGKRPPVIWRITKVESETQEVSVIFPMAPLTDETKVDGDENIAA